MISGISFHYKTSFIASPELVNLIENRLNLIKKHFLTT